MRVSSGFALAALAAALGGCAGVKVRDGVGDNARDVHGIPFYIKEPWRIQETELSSREMLVSFTVTETRFDPETGKTTEDRIAKLPTGQTLRLDDTANGRAAVQGMVDALGDKSSFVDAVARIKKGMAQLATTFGATVPETAAHCSASNYDLVANSWSMKMVAGTSRYYIEPQNPFIGSASADIHLADDGTLSESSTSVTDNTASTLLSMIPVSAYLSKVLDLPTDAAAAAPAAAGAADFALIDKALPAKAHKPPPARKPPVVRVRIDVVETPVKTLYQLRQALPLIPPAVAKGSVRLELCDALQGLKDTELVSVKTLGGSDDDKEGGDDKGAWRIAGQLLPPKGEVAGKPDHPAAGK